MVIFCSMAFMSAIISANAKLFAVSNQGLAISEDSGRTWTFEKSYSYSLGSEDYGTIFSHGTDLYVITGKGIIAVSRNYGKTWALTHRGIDIGISEREAGFADFGGNIYARTLDGLFISKDNGNSWNEISRFMGASGLYVHNGTIYTANRTSDTSDDWNLIHSADGLNWSPVSWNATDLVLPLLIAQNGNMYGHVYRHRGLANNFFGMATSNDNGSTWNYKSRAMFINCTSCDESPDIGVYCVAGKRNILFVGTPVGLAVSKDGGNTWVTKLMGKAIYGILMTNHRMYVGTNSDLSVSEDWGSTWQTAGLNGASVYSITFTETPPCGLYYGIENGWISTSRNHGTTWQQNQCSSHYAYRGISYFQFTSSEIYVGYLYDGLYVSEDAGQTWIYKSQSYPQTWSDDGEIPSNNVAGIFAVSAHDDHVCITGCNGLSCTKGGGTTWRKLLNGTFRSVLVIEESIIAVSQNSTMLSTDFGKSWIEKALPVPRYYLHETVITDNTIYFLNVVPLSDSSGLGFSVDFYRSKDLGDSWKRFIITSNRLKDSHIDASLIAIINNKTDVLPPWENNKRSHLDPRIQFDENSFLNYRREGPGPFGPPLPPDPNEYCHSWFIRGVKIYAHNGTILVGIPLGQLFMSKDDGETWTLIYVFENSYIQSIYFDHRNLYVASKNVIDGNSYALHISKNDGKTWSRISDKDTFGKENLTHTTIYIPTPGPIAGMDCPSVDSNETMNELENVNQQHYPEWYWIGIGVALPFLFIAFVVCSIWTFVKQRRLSRIIQRQRIDGSQLELVKKLGNGQFGEVWLGNYIIDRNRSTEVALKVSKHSQYDETRMSLIQADCFYQETIALNLLRHNNIISIIGSCTNLKDLNGRTTSALVLEYMNGGSAIDYMIAERGKVKKKDLVGILLDICGAGNHLSKMGVIHRDIGARNVLVRKNVSTGRPIISKLTDFGLAKDVGKLSNFYKTTNPDRAVFHMRYTAPEGFRGQYSSKSDVWSFGVFMWELYSLMSGNGIDGPVPYSHLSRQEQVLEELKNGHRLQRPLSASLEIYGIMNNCWSLEPEARPNFDTLLKAFGSKRDRLGEVASGEAGIPACASASAMNLGYGMELQASNSAQPISSVSGYGIEFQEQESMIASAYSTPATSSEFEQLSNK